MRGIDISEGSNPDFAALKKSGYDFVIARAGYGSDVSQKDKNFDRNILEAHKAGLHTGAYWFVYYRSMEEARRNADAFCAVLEPYKAIIDMPVWIDYENDTTRYYNQHSGSVENKIVATESLIQMCNRVESHGWYTGYYCNYDYLKNHFNVDALTSYALWLAIWDVSQPPVSCGIWQKSGDVTIPEVIGKVDLDECYVDYPSAIRQHGLNGFAKSAVPDTGVPQNFFGRAVIIHDNGTWEYA